jgi:UDP-N-acetylmuramoyl-tripeptide--D-alanyl-D-alanine ligase
VFRLSEILSVTQGTLLQGELDILFSGVCTDSRRVRSGDLFIALRGENFDGHEFIPQAIERGATGIIAHTPIRPYSHTVVVVQVPDTLIALGQIAALHRSRFTVPICAVTGSVGKTTTKELLGTILRARFNTLQAAASHNNEIGVPRTLLQLNESHQAVVLEFAMRGAGQIRYLADIARPTIGVITNIGESHREFFSSIEEIADAKGELLDAMDENSVSILNADDAQFRHLRAKVRGTLLTFGENELADVHVKNVRSTPPTVSFEVEAGAERVEVTLPFPGRHNALNAAAAMSAAAVFGVDLATAANALRAARPASHRMATRQTLGVTVLDDCYNASPASMHAALETLRDWQTTGRRIAVLGDMKELGDRSTEAHREVGGWVPLHNVDLLITVGTEARQIAEGARAAGFNGPRVALCDTSDEALSVVRSQILPGDVVLVKASRAMKLETVVEGLFTHEG